jgi:Protein of unknown function (DUF2752)
VKPALHRPVADEPDPEFLLLAGSAGTLAYGGAWLAAGLPFPRCAFRALTGCPCPTCGATRCFLSLIHGHILQAFAWNPLVFTSLLGLAALNLYAAAVLTTRLPRIRLSLSSIEGRALRIASVILFAANWTYEIRHGG